MSFAAVIPSGGYVGWTFLKRTMDRQQSVQQAQPQVRRDEAYFRERIADVKTAGQLVSDRRLLGIALGAFGLGDDINNRYFIRKVLEGGTFDPGALANRLADKAYREFSAAFGFGDFPVASTQISDFPDRILSAYRSRQFEVAVGQTSPTLRLALNAERELPRLAAKESSVDTKWFTILGSAPLRSVVQKAFGLPDSFSAIDLDQQLGVMKERAEKFLGSSDPAVLADPAVLDKLMRRYLALSPNDVGLSGQVRGAGALQLLQSAQGASQGGASAILALLT